MNKGLHLANEKRTARAKLKRELRAGTKSIADLILDPPECLEVARPTRAGLTIYDVLCWQPGIKEAKAKRILRAVQMPEGIEVTALSEHRRRQLVDAVSTVR